MALSEEFETFWRLFPRRTGKLAAIKAYHKARLSATAQEILDGVEHYKRTKPSYADWCHPRTFLSQGRWMDEPDQPLRLTYDWECPHTPRCPHRAACAVVSARKAG